MHFLGDYAEFARPMGAKDKKPRKRRMLRNAAIAAGGIGLAGAGGYGLLKLRGARKAAKAAQKAVDDMTSGPAALPGKRGMDTVSDPWKGGATGNKSMATKPKSQWTSTQGSLPQGKKAKRKRPRRKGRGFGGDQRGFSLLSDIAEFRRPKGAKDKKPRKRRRKTARQRNEDRWQRASAGNPYYGTKADRNIRRAELSTRSVRNVASGGRALSNISREVRSWLRLTSSLSGGGS